MPWGIAAGAAVSLIGGAMQSKAAGKAADKQQAALDQQTELGHEQLDFSKQQYSDWKQRFDPIMDDLTTEAYADQRPDYTKIAADNTAAFDASQGAAQRNLERLGVNPADGAYGDLQHQGVLQRALGLVTANTQARTAAKDQTYQRLANLYQVGNGQASDANANMRAAYSGLQSGLGNAAGTYGQMWNANTNRANNSFNDAATGIGYGVQNWLGSGNTGTQQIAPQQIGGMDMNVGNISMPMNNVGPTGG